MHQKSDFASGMLDGRKHTDTAISRRRHAADDHAYTVANHLLVSFLFTTGQFSFLFLFFCIDRSLPPKRDEHMPCMLHVVS